MMTQIKNQDAVPYLNCEIRAVLTIFQADEELKQKALPAVNLKNETINWKQIANEDFGGGHAAAIAWAKSIWTNEISENTNPMECAHAMGAKLKLAVIQALAVRWGIS